MHSEYQSNAMTEIALALAMAFFSIMVLAMLSMGSALQVERAAGPRLTPGIQLAIPAATGNEAASTRVVDAGEVIVYWRGQFFDGALRPIEPAALDGGDRRVLAIGPDLSIAEAMAVRERIATAELEVTTLDTRWMQILEERVP